VANKCLTTNADKIDWLLFSSWTYNNNNNNNTTKIPIHGAYDVYSASTLGEEEIVNMGYRITDDGIQVVEIRHISFGNLD